MAVINENRMHASVGIYSVEIYRKILLKGHNVATLIVSGRPYTINGNHFQCFECLKCVTNVKKSVWLRLYSCINSTLHCDALIP
jgi:hypothetical protein